MNESVLKIQSDEIRTQIIHINKVSINQSMLSILIILLYHLINIASYFLSINIYYDVFTSMLFFIIITIIYIQHHNNLLFFQKLKL